MDWDDIKFARALGDHRTLEAASAALSVAPSTVFRRLKKIEAELGTKLFSRDRNGYFATPIGDAVIDAAAQIADRVDALQLQIAGKNGGMSGVVRITTTDTLAAMIMPPMRTFRGKFPYISVELVVNPNFLSLSRREADIAIRPSNSPPENLFGRFLGHIGFSVYQSAHVAPFDLDDRKNWIAYDDSLAHISAHRWMRKERLTINPALTCDSIMGVREAVRCGLGLGVLPDYLAREDDDFVLARTIPDSVSTELWVLTHPDLKENQRIRTAMDHFAHALKPILREEDQTGDGE